MEVIRKNIIFFVLANVLLFVYIFNFRDDLIIEKFLLFLEIFMAEFILKDMLDIDDYGESKILKKLQKFYLEKIIYLIWIMTLLIRLDIVIINFIKLKIFLCYLNEYCFLIVFLRIISQISKEERKISQKTKNNQIE